MQRLIKLLVLTFIGVSTLTTLKAVPAYPGLIQQKQSDGTTLNYYLFGDEFFSWARTTDNYTIKRNDIGDYVYMLKDSDGDLVISDVIAHNPESRTQAELLFLSTIEPKMFYSESQIAIVKQAIEIRKVENAKSSRAFPTTGNRKLICILIGFTDKAFTKTQAEFNALFNQVGYSAGGATGSVKDYYLENSYNQFNLTVDVAGPYTANQNMAYYGANDASGNDIRPRELVIEAINLADPHVNFANYDNDNDGWVDGVYIIYAGYGEEAGGGADAIWAHAWSLATAVTKDGVKLQKYSCSAELRGNSGTNITNIGVICHEFGHVLGAPDYYDTNYSTGGQYEGTGNWDMMAGGSWNNDGATPAHHNGFTKTKVYNWAPVVTLNQPVTVTLQQATYNSNSFYQINTTTTNEYFFIENRQQQGFDAYIPGHGMIIYHVHATVNQNFYSNDINATHPQKMYPVCASATMDPTSTPSSYGSINSLGCAWPYGTTKTSFTDNTLPSSKSWAGNNTNKPITNIVRNTTNKTVTFDFMGGGGGIYTTTFTVTDAGNILISGASIAINSQTLITNFSGVATISLANGTYPYTVSKDGYVNGTGNAVVDGANLSINVTLQDEIVAPYGVTATVVNVNQAHVTWNPDLDFIDDIESYNDFIISNIGNYTLVDVDGSPTYGVQDVSFTNAGYTGSYIVFNPSAATPALSGAWAPHSGNKYLACFAATSPPNNDWLITHQVNVAPGMKFSFWARSLTTQWGADRFKVGVSTTGTAPANFTFLTGSGYIEPPATWTQYTYNLDAYVGQQIYLAINCVSSDSFVLMIDDVFIGASKSDDSKAFLGYTVYLNDQVKASGLTTKEYTITDIPAGTHNVGVQSVYSSGASAIVYADPITISPQYYTVTFKVVDPSNTPISGASIAINSQTLTTNASGIATISLENGTYPYIISKAGFVSANGDAVVNGANITVNKTLTYQEYSLTLVANPVVGGTVNNDVSGNYHIGESITVIATPAEGYQFVNWAKDGVQVSTNAQFDYIMPSENVTLTANFETIPTYTITFTVVDVANSPIADASIAINSQTLTTNDSGVATISLANGTYPYTISKTGFVNVTGSAIVNGANISINTTLTYQDYTLTLVANPNTGGTVNSVSGNYHMGDNITVIATPADGYNFINWTKDGVQVSVDAQFVYTMPSENVTLTANFATISSHTVTFTVVDAENNPIENATVAINEETKTTNASGIATISLEDGTYPYTVSKSGYINVTGDAVVSGANVSINVTLNHETFTLTLVANPANGGTVNDVGGEYQAGTSVTVIATPAAGYNFINWTKDGVQVSVNAQFVYTMPSENVTLTANFATISSHTVTFTVVDVENNPIENATVVINEETRTTNASGIATINLENGTYPYTISKVGFVNGTGDAVVNGADVSINVTLNHETFTLTLVANPANGGTVNNVGGEYQAGANITVTAIPAEGYNFVNWSKDGVVVNTNAEFVYTMPSENVTLTANFETVPTYIVTFTVNNSENSPIEGAIIEINSQTLTTDVSGVATISLENGTYSYTVSKAGYINAIGDAVVNGTDVSINVTLNHETFTLTLVANPANGGTVNNVGGEYQAGANITVTATPAEGYNFVNWSRDGVVVNTNAEFVYTMPSENVTLTANFETVPTYIVTFTVNNSENSPIEGAIIEINSQTLTTDVSGVATISLENGTYSYTVSKAGYINATGDAVVNGADVSINVTLNHETFTLTLVANPANGGTVNNVGGEYQAGANITVTATPAEGYNFVNWSRDGVVVNTNAEFTYTMPSENVTLTANFELIPTYTVTFTVVDASNSPIEGASVVIGSESFTTNASGIATVILENGTYPYTVSKAGYINATGDAVVNGADISVNVTLNYETFTLTLVANPANGGTVNNVGGEYQAGTSVTVIASSAEGFVFVNWTKDGVEVSTDAQFDYTMPSEDVILTANFEITYTVTFKIIFSSGDPIEGVTILVNGEVLITDSSGTATINLPSGEYSFTISGNESSFIVINEDITVVFVWPSPVFEITFYAVHNGTPLEGVRIHVDGHATTTNAQGNAVEHLANGSYTYIATKEGYNDLEGSFVVDNAEQTIVLNMTGIGGVAENLVRLYPNPVESILTIERNSSDEVVIEIYNSGGTLMSTTKTEKSTITMDVKTLGVGTYFVRIIGANETTVHKFIKR